MSTPGQCPTVPSDIAFITGPSMIGICFNWGFLGVLLVQLYFYHVNFHNQDRMLIKVLVYGLAIIDVLQTCLVTADAFHWFVFHFGNLDKLDDVFLNSWDVVLIDAVVSLIVQTFYCWRIYILRRSFMLPIPILLVSVMQCICGIIKAVNSNRLGKIHLIGSDSVAEQTIWLVGSAVADVMITLAISWTLLRRSKDAAEFSHGIVRRVVTLTVETNAITALTAVLAVIVYLGVTKYPALVVPPTAILGKLYTNCLIAVFNNRRMERAPAPSYPSSSGQSRPQRQTFGVPAPTYHSEDPGLKVQVIHPADHDQSFDMELGSIGKTGKV